MDSKSRTLIDASLLLYEAKKDQYETNKLIKIALDNEMDILKKEIELTFKKHNVKVETSVYIDLKKEESK